MDTARDGTGTLIEEANRQCAVASSWPAASGPGVREFSNARLYSIPGTTQHFDVLQSTHSNSRCKLTLPPPHTSAQHLTGASRFVHAMSAWSIKTRRAPFRNCRDARVYGHTTTTVMHEISTTLAPTLPHPPTEPRPKLTDVHSRATVYIDQNKLSQVAAARKACQKALSRAAPHVGKPLRSAGGQG